MARGKVNTPSNFYDSDDQLIYQQGRISERPDGSGPKYDFVNIVSCSNTTIGENGVYNYTLVEEKNKDGLSTSRRVAVDLG